MCDINQQKLDKQTTCCFDISPQKLKTREKSC